MAAGGWDVIRKPDSFSLLVLSGHLCRVGAFSSRQIAPLVGNERSSSKFNCFRWSLDWTVSLISIKWNSDGPDLWLLIAVIFSNLEIFDRFNVMTSIGCTWSLGLKSSTRGFSLKKVLVDPKKSEKNPKNSRNFLGFKIRTPYLGVNNPSISVFKSLFIHKILVHPKKSEKNSKNLKKMQ